MNLKSRSLLLASCLLLPCSGLADPALFPVRDYGAVPGQDSDAGPAIRAAVAAAIASGGPARVVFEKGEYRIGSAGKDGWWPKVALPVSKAKDLALCGVPGSLIVVTDPTLAGIVLKDSEDVTVRDLALDYDPVPYVQSTVVSVQPEQNTFEVEPDADDRGFLHYGDPCYQEPKSSSMGLTFRRDGQGRPAYGLIPIGTEVVGQTGPRRWKLGASQKFGHTRPDAVAVSGLAVGDRFIDTYHPSYTAGFSIIHCVRPTVENVTVYSSPGLAFFPHLSEKVVLRGCSVEIRPGLRRCLSSNADGVHARGNRGITVEDCTFSGMGDDGINLHSSSIVPLLRSSPTEFVVRRSTFSIRAGDVLQLVRPETASVLGQYTVQAVDEHAPDGTHVQFAEAPPEEVHLGKDNASGDQFFNLSEANNDFVVRNNWFGPHHGREMLIEAWGGLVEDNHFENTWGNCAPAAVSTNPAWSQAMAVCFGQTVQMLYDPSWGEGPITQGVTIRDNRFAGKSAFAEQILISDQIRGNHPATEGHHENIEITGNTFESLGAPAMRIHYVKNLTIRDNHVIASAEARPVSTTPAAAILLTGCPQPVLSGNRIDDRAFPQPALVKP